MSYIHVLVQMKATDKNKAVVYEESNLEQTFVINNIVKPYVQGGLVFIDGSRAQTENIEKIAVYSSEMSSEELVEAERARNKSSSARERANRIFSGGSMKATLVSALQGADAVNITRKVFNEALGIAE